MISVAEARSRILAGVEPLPAEWVMLSEAHGRVLATDAVSRRTQPPLAVSAMDGYAVRGEDVRSAPATLRQVGAVAAGQVYRGSVGPGEAVRIFTGAPLPDGADTVVIQENVRAEDAAITVLEPATAGRHVRRAGIDFREGEVGLPAGRRLTSRDIGLAAGMNLPWLPVRRRPRVAILATGDEIVLPGEPLAEGQIIGSSGPALAAFIRSCGGLPVSLGVARDRRDDLQERARGAAGADILVTLGGASVGEHDLVQSALAEQGLTLEFWKIAMRPGKPLMFGHMGAMRMLGLPGNPVSTMVCALLFLRPLIAGFLGRSDAEAPHLRARLAAPLGANDIREDYLRATLSRDADGALIARPFEVQDSSMLAALARADALLVRPPHAPPASAGELVEVIPFDPDGAGF